MILQDFVFFYTKAKKWPGIPRGDKAVRTSKRPHKGFKSNTMARPRPEWTDDKVKTRKRPDKGV